MILAYFFILVGLCLPPIHEGLHAMACVITGTKIVNVGLVNMDYEISSAKMNYNPLINNSHEFIASFPYWPLFFFFGLMMGKIIENFRISKKLKEKGECTEITN